MQLSCCSWEDKEPVTYFPNMMHSHLLLQSKFVKMLPVIEILCVLKISLLPFIFFLQMYLVK